MSKNTLATRKMAEQLIKSKFISRFPLSNNYKRKIAFTLAEVLLVLMIIGIVASIVIPTLIINIQDAEFKTAWKKEYAVITQATQRIINDNGGSLNGVFSNTTVAINLYSQYLSIAKDCSEFSSNFGGNCWATETSGGNSWATSDKRTITGGQGILLNDGTAIAFDAGSTASCTTGDLLFYPSVRISNSTMLTNCTSMLVDINGFRPPNSIGRDVFGIVILPNKVLPYGPNVYSMFASKYKNYSNSYSYIVD